MNPQPEQPQLLYTARQASERLGTNEHGRAIVSAFWLERQAAARAIPCRYLAGRLAFSEADLLALIEQCSGNPENYGRSAA